MEIMANRNYNAIKKYPSERRRAASVTIVYRSIQRPQAEKPRICALKAEEK